MSVRAFGSHRTRAIIAERPVRSSSWRPNRSRSPSGGALLALENVIAPGDGPPLHRHEREDEAWYVIEGDLSFQLGEEIAAAPGARFAPGENTFSATPLAWSHSQLIRLAHSIDAGAPVETPQVVACRYATTLCRP